MRIKCPGGCGRITEDWAIAGGKCSQCRAEAERKTHPGRVLTWADIRAGRNRRLAACDWVNTSPRLGPAARAAWTEYRNQLFDLPDNFDNPADVVWPTPPEQEK